MLEIGQLLLCEHLKLFTVVRVSFFILICEGVRMIILHRCHTYPIILTDNRQITEIRPQIIIGACACTSLHVFVLLQRCSTGRRCAIGRHSDYMVPDQLRLLLTSLLHRLA